MDKTEEFNEKLKTIKVKPSTKGDVLLKQVMEFRKAMEESNKHLDICLYSDLPK
jgi:peroxiredoxin